MFSLKGELLDPVSTAGSPVATPCRPIQQTCSVSNYVLSARIRYIAFFAAHSAGSIFRCNCPGTVAFSKLGLRLASSHVNALLGFSLLHQLSTARRQPGRMNSAAWMTERWVCCCCGPNLPTLLHQLPKNATKGLSASAVTVSPKINGRSGKHNGVLTQQRDSLEQKTVRCKGDLAAHP